MLTDYQEYIARSRYARFLPDEKRRETWEETINRYVKFFSDQHPDIFPSSAVFDAIHSLNVMPSMRALMTAGKALSRDQASGYNCSYIAVDDPRAFDETMYLLMTGCGVGFSVERQAITRLPIVSEDFFETDTVIKVRDSKIGWASAYRELIAMLYSGRIPTWDLSALRPAGAPLKTFGGRSSGPQPLNDLFKFTVRIFKNAAGRKLQSIECHDILNSIASAIVVGGVRRCLPDNTLVQIAPNEWKEIKQFNVGDSVFIQNKYHKVSNVFEQGVQSVAKIELEDNTYLESTAIHKWFVFDKVTGESYWKNTDELTTGDLFYNDAGIRTAVKSLTLISRAAYTYDLEVDSNDHAFIAKHPIGNGIGVSHNSAQISLSNLSDDRMRNAKMGQWWVDNPQRALANNSVAYTEKPDMGVFMQEWKSLYDSKSGERGIFNRQAALHKIKKIGRRDAKKAEEMFLGANPCCVTGDMIVDLKVGKEIKSISVDDAVALYASGNDIAILSFNTVTKTEGYGNVTFAGCTRINAKIIKITDQWSGKFIRVTDDHLVYTTNRGYVRADEIVQSDLLLLSNEALLDSNTVRFESLVIEEDGVEDVYDFTVPETNNFFVNGVLVHNCEIFLRSAGFCNLTEVVIRPGDTLETLLKKVEIASIMGTFQSSLTNFRYLRNIWKKNADEERLLGVSLTGIMDHELLSSVSDTAIEWLTKMREQAIETNRIWAEKLGINQSAAVTAVKPSGCTTAETKIKTSAGVLSMQQLFELSGYNISDYDTIEQTWLDTKNLLPQVYDENNDLQPITKLYINGLSPVIEIQCEDGNTYKFTPNHKLLTVDGWTRVDELLDNDIILSYDKDGNKSSIALVSISGIVLSRELTVDIEVANTHTYQLANGVVSHNTVSQLVDCSSGIHPRHSRYYMRTVRSDKLDPIGMFLKDQGIFCEDDVMKPEKTWVFGFPIKSPDCSKLTSDVSALDQLNHYLMFYRHWAEHTVSITVYVRENEWMAVGAWVYEHFDEVGGISFFPHSDHSYQQAPIQPIDVAAYDALVAKTPKINWTEFSVNEHEDKTEGAQQLACAGGLCEL